MGLKDQAVKGFAWTSTGTIGYGALNLIVTILLARRLTPHDFGIIELLIVFSSISDILVDSGFSQAVIRDNHATDKDLSTVFYLNIFIAFCLYALLFFASSFIAHFYEEPIMRDLSRFTFLTIIFNSFAVIQNANFSRNLNFKPFALASIIAILISGFISIFLAYQNYGVWALASNLVVFSFCRMCLLWFFSRWYPHLLFSWNSLKKYFFFGSKLLIQGLTDKIVTNLESLLIGKFYVKQQLGFFSQGRKLDSYVIQTSSNVVQKVSYPLLAKIQGEEKRLKDGYRTVLGVTMCCITPIIGIMITGADYIMGGFFGIQWLPAAPYLKLWALCGWMVTFYSIFINIFLVNGKSGQLLTCSIARQILRIISIIVFVRISIMHMMLSIVAVTAIGCFIYVYIGGKLISYSPIDAFKDIWQILFSTLFACLLASYLTCIICMQSYISSLIVLCSFITTIYILCLYLLKNVFLKEIISIIKRK